MKRVKVRPKARKIPAGGRRARVSLFVLTLCLFIGGVAAVREADADLGTGKASGKGYGWDFERSSELSGWSAMNGRLGVYRGRLISDRSIPGQSMPAKNLRLFSPPGLGIPASINILSIRVRSRSSGIMQIMTSYGPKRKTIIDERYLSGAEVDQELRVYLGNPPSGADHIRRLSFDFSAAVDGYSIEEIKFYRGSTAETLGALWDSFSSPQIISISTVNFISTPRLGSIGLTLWLYLLTAALTAAFVFLYLRSGTGSAVPVGPGLRCGAARAVTAGFVLAGILFTARMDYNWVSIFQHDRARLVGLENLERLKVINSEIDGEFFDFIGFLRQAVPEGEEVRPAARVSYNYIERMTRYYMLPVKTSEEARYLWSYGMALGYDPSWGAGSAGGPREGWGALTKGAEVVAAPVRLKEGFRGTNSGVYEATGVANINEERI